MPDVPRLGKQKLGARRCAQHRKDEEPARAAQCEAGFDKAPVPRRLGADEQDESLRVADLSQTSIRGRPPLLQVQRGLDGDRGAQVVVPSADDARVLREQVRDAPRLLS